MTQRKPTLAELDQLVTQARALTAQECQSWHPEKGARCQLEAGHAGAHEWRYVAGNRPWFWSDGGVAYREPEKLRRRGRLVIAQRKEA